MGLLDETLGAIFIGIVIAATLYGVSCTQILYYYSRYPDDTWRLKLLVLTVWVSESLHQSLITHAVYTYLITNYNNPMVLNDVLWSLIVQVALVGLNALLVQSFYTLRIWNLSENNAWISVLVAVLVLGEFGSIVAYTFKALRLRTFDELNALKELLMSVYAIAAAGDLLIAITLSVLLHGSRTGYRRSDGLINKLIAFTVNTGLLTSICAICSLVAIAVLPTAFIYVAFFFLMGRLHTNSLLATLNARKILRVRTVGDDVLSLSLQDLQGSDTLASGRRNRIPERLPLDLDDTKSQSQERLVSQARPVPRLGTLGSALAPSRSMTGP